MKKIAQIAAIVVVVVVGILLLLPIAFRGKIGEVVKREANEMLHGQLTFEKFDISLWRHFPNASLELKGLMVTAGDSFTGDTVVAVKRISVAVNMLSLFSDDGFEVTKVFVTQPYIYARKSASGAVNWDLFKRADTIAKSATITPSVDATPSSFRLRVQDVSIRDAHLRYNNDSTGVCISSSSASLRLKGDLSAAHTALQVEFLAQGVRMVSSGVSLLSGAEAELDATIEADLANNRYTFSHNTLRLNAIQVTLDGWVEMQTKSLALDLRAECEKVQFKDVLSLIPAFYTREFRNLAAAGELSMSLWARGTAHGKTLPAFELKSEVHNGSFQYSSLPKAVTNIALVARISNPGGTKEKTEIDISRLGFNMAGNELTASLYLTNIGVDPIFRAAASGRFDLGAVKEVFPLSKTVELGGVISADARVSARRSDVDQKRYEQIAANGTIVVEKFGITLPDLPKLFIRRAAATITPSTMTLGDFGATIGRSDITANGQLTGYIGYLLRGDLLSGRLYVKSEMLDLNEFMGISAEATTEPGDVVSDDEVVVKRVQTLVVPCNLNLSLSAEFQQILFRRMTISNLSGAMHIGGGVLSMDRLNMNLFGGRVGASGNYSTVVDAARPVLKLSADIASASFEKTFQEVEIVQRMVPLFEKTGGNYSLSLNLSTAFGAKMTPDLNTLNATGEISSANINVQNIGAFDALAKALNNDALRQIKARDVTIRFTIRDGRLHTQPFDMTLGDVNVNMSGSTGLDQTIDYVARVSLPSSATGGVLSSVNVNIGGTYSIPKITIGMKEAAQEAIKNVIDDQVQRLTGSENLSAEIQKQAANLREEAQRVGAKLIEAAETQRTKLVESVADKGPLAKIAAQKAGDKIVEVARSQSTKLVAEAEAQIEKLSTTNPPATNQ